MTITSEPKEYALVEAIEDDELESLDLPPVKLEEWSSCLNLSLEAVHEKAMEKYHKHFPHRFDFICVSDRAGDFLLHKFVCIVIPVLF